MIIYFIFAIFLIDVTSTCNVKKLVVKPNQLSLSSKESSYIEITPDVFCDTKLYIEKTSDKIERLDKCYRLSNTQKFKFKITAKDNISEESNIDIRVKVSNKMQTIPITLHTSSQIPLKYEITMPQNNQIFYEQKQVPIHITIFGKTTKDIVFDVYIDNTLQQDISLSVLKGKTKLSTNISPSYNLSEKQNDISMKIKPKDTTLFEPSSQEVSLIVLQSLPNIIITPSSFLIYNSSSKLITFAVESKYEINLTEDIKVKVIEPLDNCFNVLEYTSNKDVKEFIIDKNILKKDMLITTKENCKKKQSTIKFQYLDDRNKKEISEEPVNINVDVKEQSLLSLSVDYSIPESTVKFNESYKITISLNKQMTQDNSSCDPITLEYHSTSNILTLEPSSITFNCTNTPIVQEIKIQLYSVDVKKNTTEIYYDLKSDNKLIENLPSKTFLVDVESLSGKGKIKLSYKNKKKINDDTKITFKLTKCPIVFGGLENLRIKIIPDEDSEGEVSVKEDYIEWVAGKDCSDYGLSKDIKVEGKTVGNVKFYVQLDGSAKNKYSYKQSFKMEFYEEKDSKKEIEVEVDDFDDDTLITAKGQKIKLEIDGKPKEDLYIKVDYDKEELVIIPDVIKFEDEEDDDVYITVYSISEETEHSTISFSVKNEDDFDDDDEDMIEVPDNLKLKICGIRDCVDLSQGNEDNNESSEFNDDEDENNTVTDLNSMVGIVVLVVLIIIMLFIYFVVQ